MYTSLLGTATIVGVDWWVAVGCLLIVFVGATVQSSIGIGLGLIASPLLGLADHAFVPVALLLATLPMTMSMALHEREHIDRKGIEWAVAGRIPGTIAGAYVAARASHSALAVVIAISVLLAVAASASGVHFRPTRRNLLIAGTASGFGGTAVGIGGPPMALTYQHQNPATMRSTLGTFFVIGLVISLVTLAIGGVMTRRTLELGALLVPASLAGAMAGRRVTRWLPPDRLRPMVLVLCTASALVLFAGVVL